MNQWDSGSAIPEDPLRGTPASCHVLLVDDDIGTLEAFELILRNLGFSVVMARCGEQALVRARQCRTGVMLVNLQLPDVYGLDLIRQLRSERILTPIVIMTAHGTIRSAIDAMRAGVLDYLEKPLSDQDLIRVVRDGLALSTPGGDRPRTPAWPEPHAAQRWAKLVASALHAPTDPRTLDDWSHLAHVSRSTLENRCRAANLSPKKSLDFARVLRAIVQGCRIGCPFGDFLDGDYRTLDRLLRDAGAPSLRASDTGSIHVSRFLQRQRFITNRVALEAISVEIAVRHP